MFLYNTVVLVGNGDRLGRVRAPDGTATSTRTTTSVWGAGVAGPLCCINSKIRISFAIKSHTEQKVTALYGSPMLDDFLRYRDPLETPPSALSGYC